MGLSTLKHLGFAILLFGFLSACAVAPTPQDTGPDQQPAPSQQSKPEFFQSYDAGKAAYERVVDQVKPVVSNVCAQFDQGAPKNFCNFQYIVLDDPKAPVNAYQTVDRQGNPLIVFTSNMLRAMKNDHEIAFIIGHESGSSNRPPFGTKTQ